MQVIKMTLLLVFGLVATVGVDGASSTYCSDELECSHDTLSSSDSVVCNGDQACFGASIYTAEKTDCSGYQGCYKADITSDDDIYCNGERGCYQASIATSETGSIECNGFEGCYYTQIGNTRSLFSEGYYSSAYCDISISGDQSFTGFFAGYYSNTMTDLTCDEDSYCKVYCGSPTACTNLDIYCYGDCSYNCDEDIEDCPTIYDYSSQDVSDEIKLKWDDYRQERTLLKKQLKNEIESINNSNINSNDNGNGLMNYDKIKNLQNQCELKMSLLSKKYSMYKHEKRNNNKKKSMLSTIINNYKEGQRFMGRGGINEYKPLPFLLPFVALIAIDVYFVFVCLRKNIIKSKKDGYQALM